MKAEQLEKIQAQVKLEIQAAQLEAMRRVARAGPKAIETLAKLAESAEDERAKYSAAAKLTDMLLPRQQTPLVQINVGDFKSHLNLPSAPVVAPIDVTPEEISGRSAVSVIREELRKRAERDIIPPEAIRHRDFMRQRFGITEIPGYVPEVFEAKAPPEPQKLELKGTEQIPAATAFPDSE